MKRFVLCCLMIVLGVIGVIPASATNGDFLISVGTISRSMGGVGIALPQDAVSSVFLNPASMSFGKFCPGSEINFDGTLFMPKVDARVTAGGVATSGDSKSKVYAIPSIGLTVPLTKAMPLWRFGLAAYGVRGLGVDYQNSALDNQKYFGSYPLVSAPYTQEMTMKLAPALSFQPLEYLSLGLSLHIDYSTLDLGQGTSQGYSAGAQLGVSYKPDNMVALGLTYVTPQPVNYDNVADLDGDGKKDSLKMASPNIIGFGVAVAPVKDMLLFELDVKWLNWSSAQGYKDFDWRDQWVLGLGAQYRPISKLALRAGYNYGKNPLKDHHIIGGMAMNTVQGKTMPNYYYETFRVIGFPAIVEHHLSVGVGYDFTDKFGVNLGYVHSFRKSFSESGYDITGGPASMQSRLGENSIDFGLTWKL